MLPAAVYGGLSEPAPATTETLRVRVLADGFEFKGERHGSLSAIAKPYGERCRRSLRRAYPEALRRPSATGS
jgi:hypothetical protein